MMFQSECILCFALFIQVCISLFHSFPTPLEVKPRTLFAFLCYRSYVCCGCAGCWDVCLLPGGCLDGPSQSHDPFFCESFLCCTAVWGACVFGGWCDRVAEGVFAGWCGTADARVSEGVVDGGSEAQTGSQTEG